ncbi:MAG: phospholipase D family protein [Silvibacterium sp.]
MDGTPIRNSSKPISLLRNPWDSQLADLLSSPREFLLVASPFITRSVANWVGEQLNRNAAATKLQILCLTNVRIESVLSGSLELEGLADLGRAFQGFVPVHLPALHAKVFIADKKYAIVTSGNLTHGGLRANYEYGVAIKDHQLVRVIRRDFEGYASLGARLNLDQIVSLIEEFSGLRAEYQKQERGTLKAAGTAFRGRLRAAEDKVLQIRAEGMSNQAIFCNTIEYLLSKGPLSTAELHPRIQQIHPDICDDTVDRIIAGVSFGKKWKHLVRNAQQALKRAGRISYDGIWWRLAGDAKLNRQPSVDFPARSPELNR